MYICKVPIVCDLYTNISACIALHSQSYKKLLRNRVITPNNCHANRRKEKVTEIYDLQIHFKCHRLQYTNTV